MALDAILPTWINAPDDVSAPLYTADTLRRTTGGLLIGGVAAGVARSGVLDPRGLVVTLSGSNVQVGPGRCAVGTVAGAYLTGAAATGTVDVLLPADATNPRRDRVMLVILDPDNGASGTARKAEFRYLPGTPSATALSGGGYPPVPTGITGFVDLYDVDVPKSGGGSPVVTDRRPFTVAAGAPILVRSLAERDGLPAKWDGLQVIRLDLSGRPVQTWDGAKWTGGAQSGLYTPTLTAATNPTLGAGSQQLGRYTVNGDVMEVQAFIAFGTSGSNVGSGSYLISLPPGFSYGGLGSAVPLGVFAAKLPTALDISGFVTLSAAGVGQLLMKWQSVTNKQSVVGSGTSSWGAGTYMALTASIPLA